MSDMNKISTLSELADSIPDVIAPTFTLSFIRLNKDIKVDVPQRLQKDPLIKALVKYFNSPWHSAQNRSTTVLSKYAKTLTMLFDKALAGFDYVPDTVGSYWLKAIKEKSDSETEARAHNLTITAAFERILKRKVSDVEFSSDELIAVAKFKQIWPSLRWQRSEPQKTLEQLTTLNHKNRELFASLRFFCCWYIQEWSSVIQQFKEKLPIEYEVIREEINKFAADSFFHQKSRHIKKASIIEREIKKRGSLSSEERIICPLIWVKAANTIDSELLKDLVYVAFRMCRYESDSLNMEYDINNEFLRFTKPISSEERNKYLSTLIINEKISYVKIPQLPPITALVSPSFEMQISTAWLLASDRHQASNLNLMTLSSIRKIENSITTIVEATSFKGRNNGLTISAEKLKKSGEVYKSNHSIHKSLLKYRNHAEQAYIDNFFVRDENELHEQFLLPFIPFQPGLLVNKHERYSDSDIGKTASYALKPTTERNLGFLAIIAENTVINQHIKESKSIEFCELLGFSMFSNGRTKSRGGGSTRNFVKATGSEIAISPAFIAQTEPIAKRMSNISVSKNMLLRSDYESDDLETQEKIEAKKANHTVAVRHDVYINRTKDKLKLESESKFAEMVGNEMIAVAMELSVEKKNKSRLLTLGEVSLHLGLSTPQAEELESLDQLLQVSKLQDYVIDSTGILLKDGEFIVTKTPVVAALMTAYIEHIEKSFEQVVESNEDLAKGLIAHLMFLQAMLNEFDAKTKREAKELYGDSAFPFPDLIA